MTGWPQRLRELAACHGAAARAVIVAASGPTPREIGSALLVAGEHVEGRIGRGRIEDEVVAAARDLCRRRNEAAAAHVWWREVRAFAGGYVMDEPTGGEVKVLIEVVSPAEAELLDIEAVVLARPLRSGVAPTLLPEPVAPARLPAAVQPAALALGRVPGRPLRLVDAPAVITNPDGHGQLFSAPYEPWLLERMGPLLLPFHVYGTGLLARALVATLDPLPFSVHWIDAEPARFPATPSVTAALRVATPDPAGLAGQAPEAAFHAVMTQAHDLDYAICRAVLLSGRFGYLGVIGSEVKRQRMSARLLADGVAAEALRRVSCPIGLAGIRSKQPQVIAVSVAAEALLALERLQSNQDQPTASSL